MHALTWQCAGPVLAIVAALGGGRGQSTPLDYRTLVEAYRSGDSAPVDRVTAVEARAVRSWVQRAVSDDSGVWDAEALRAAAILHTEAWHGSVSSGRLETGALHLDAATRLMTRVRSEAPRYAEYIDRWRTAVAGLLRPLANAGLADEFAARTTPLFPIAQPRRLAMESFAKGVEAERRGSEQGVSARIGSYAGQPHQGWWAAAVAAYEDALDKDPSYRPPALHLGRVRMLQGRRAEAARHFERAADADDPRVRYLAQLFLGSLAERDGRYADAERAYVGAIGIYPSGQAGPLALSQILSRTGREAEARQAIAYLVTRTGAITEPLWTYLPPPRMDVMDHQRALVELRAEVRK